MALPLYYLPTGQLAQPNRFKLIKQSKIDFSNFWVRPKFIVQVLGKNYETTSPPFLAW